MNTTNLFYGERVRLTALRPEDAQTMAHWYEDGEFARLFDANPPYPKTESALCQVDGQRRARHETPSRWRSACSTATT